MSFDRSKVPQEIRDSLERLFAFSIEDYRESANEIRRAPPEDGFAYASVESQHPRVRAELQNLVPYLTKAEIYPLLHVDWMDEGHTPRWSKEQRVEHALEELCSWVGLRAYCREIKDASQAVADFLSRIGQAKTEVAYIPLLCPVFGGTIPRTLTVQLTPRVSLQPLLESEYELVSIHIATGMGERFRWLGRYAFVVSVPLGSKKSRFNREVATGIDKFRIFLRGFFNGALYAPLHLTGWVCPWHGWQQASGGLPLEVDHGRRSVHLSEYQLKLLKKYCEDPHEDSVLRYSVTANRLEQAEQRDNLIDKVLDLAIAIEGLFDGGSAHSYAITAACLTEPVPARRQAVMELVKGFFELRNSIAHGEDPNHSKAGKRFGNSKVDVSEKLSQTFQLTQKLLKIHLLNRNIRSDADKDKFILAPGTLVEEPSL